VAIRCAVLMASMSGSALADTAALATILLPMMRQQGYPMATSAGLIASGGIIAPIIPPSMPFVIYGVTTNTSISASCLSRASCRGLLMGVGLIVTWRFVLRKIDLPKGQPLPMRERLARLGQGVLGPADADHHHRRHEVRRVHADRSGRRGGLLCAGGGPVRAPRDEAGRHLRRAVCGQPRPRRW
jgi:TRAP-type mannitol/chloroaromatic compound transport system permease large subunit